MLRITLVTLVGALLLVGCGGSSGSGSGGTEPLTKEQWIAAADKICTDADAARDALPEPTSIEGIVTQVEAIIPIITKEMADLRALAAPKGDEATIDAMLTAAAEQLTLANGLLDLAKKGDLAALETYISENDAKLETARTLAQGYGLKVCGTNG
jgi:hypothetical protein